MTGKNHWSEYWLNKAMEHYNSGKIELSWLVLFVNC